MPNKSSDLFEKINHCLADMESCRDVIKNVLKDLEVSGVSVDLVYHLEYLTMCLRRIEVLLYLRPSDLSESTAGIVTGFIAQLVREGTSNATLRHLIQKNLHLLSRKIVERAGTSGEHYITRTRKEYWEMLTSASGGGVLTCLTTVVKIVLSHAHVAFFFEGFFSWLNYSSSFLLMQYCHFTLATKQPSMTASALAGKLISVKEGAPLHGFVSEVVCIVRSQFAAAVGNVGAVIPTVILFDLVFQRIMGQPTMAAEYAVRTIQSLNPFGGLTLFYAAFTGFLLWLSSVSAGWIENWVVYRQLPAALAKNRKINMIFGKKMSEAFAKSFLKNISGISGNVSLALFLAFTPIFGKFFGIPLDSRHVTLSTGTLTFALSSLAKAHLITFWPVFLACLGIICIGILNFGVSFLLALFVASRARQLKDAWLFRLAKAVWVQFKRKPLDFFYAPKDHIPTQNG